MASGFEYGTTGKPHPYHILNPSPWPLVSSIAAGLMVVLTVNYLYNYRQALNDFQNEAVEVFSAPFPYGPIIGALCIMACMYLWWRDVINEGVKEKAHTPIAKIGFRYGMALFISSEVMFFVAFFWAFFYAALDPTEAINFTWPPEHIHTIAAFDLPFLMTMILLLSGCSVTWAHHAIQHGNQEEFKQGLFWTCVLGVIFMGLQAYEYAHAHFGFTEGIYPSAFFMATGFHGFHVFVGTVFLIICYLRARRGDFTKEDHFGFEAAAWYWHFVDVVWLFLFVSIYWWGS